jgi:hypothetical protein
VKLERTYRYLALVSGVLAFLAASGCSLGKDKGEGPQVKVMAQQVARDQAERYVQDVGKAFEVGKSPAYNDAGPLPCSDGAVHEDTPYRYIYTAVVDDIPAVQLDAAILRARAHFEKSGWKITKFKSASGSNKITDLAGRNPVDGYGFSLEALHDANRLAISIGSPCYKHPPGDAGGV